MWECVGGWELRKCLLEERERKQAFIEGAFIEVLSAAASKSLIHFKKSLEDFPCPVGSVF